MSETKKEFVFKEMENFRLLPAKEAAELALKNHADDLEGLVHYLVAQGHGAMGMMNQMVPTMNILQKEYLRMFTLVHDICEKWLTGYPRQKVEKEALKSQEAITNMMNSVETPEARA